MAESIRDAMNLAIDRRAIAPAAAAFELDHVSTFEAIAIPLAPIAGQLADAITTSAALHRGFVEGNPAMKGLVKNMPLFFALKIGAGALLAVEIKKLQDKGHKNAARVASVLGTLAGAGPAISNLRLMGKL